MKYGLIMDKDGGWECGYCGEAVDVGAVNVSDTLQDLLAAATTALNVLVATKYMSSKITEGAGAAAITQLRAAIKKAKGK